MRRLKEMLLLVCFCVILLCAESEAQKEFAFMYNSIDSIPLKVYECRDVHNILTGYMAHVETPVCEDQRCEEVKLDLYWDLVGDFSRLVVDAERPLTKLDHVPFNQADYDKLESILHSKNPSFIHLRKSELIEDQHGISDAPIDGISGATVQAVKRDMVLGAVYTCYTLWHLANGGVGFQLAEQTRRRLDDHLIHHLLEHNDLEVHHFLLEHLSAEAFDENLVELARLGLSHDSYFASRFLMRVQNRHVQIPEVQELIYQCFPSIGLSGQSQLINMVASSQFNGVSLKDYLIRQLSPNYPILNEKIIDMILHQVASPGDMNLLRTMQNVLIERDLGMVEHQWLHLYNLIKDDRSLRSKMKRISKF